MSLGALPLDPLAAALTILSPVAKAVADWIEGKSAEEPPALKRLGLSELELAVARQRAKANRIFRESRT